jgi:hypothetical protein
MAVGADDVGTGTTIAFGTSAFVAHLLSVNGSDITRPVIDSTHMETTGERTKIFGDLFDAGSVECEIAFDPDLQPPIGAAVETITITFPVPTGMATGATLIGTGACTAWSWTDPLEDKMTATLTVTWDGETGPEWTVSAA